MRAGSAFGRLRSIWHKAENNPLNSLLCIFGGRETAPLGRPERLSVSICSRSANHAESEWDAAALMNVFGEAFGQAGNSSAGETGAAGMG